MDGGWVCREDGMLKVVSKNKTFQKNLKTYWYSSTFHIYGRYMHRHICISYIHEKLKHNYSISVQNLPNRHYKVTNKKPITKNPLWMC